MPALDTILKTRLDALEAGHRRRLPKGAPPGLISFSSNDYLGLSRHAQVIRAAVEATERYGAGAGASRMVSGEHPLYPELEARLAAWAGTEAACVFGSGYLANLGAVGALVGKDDLILADKLCHASMIDAARLSGAAFRRFRHNDPAHLAALLAQHRGAYRHCLILTESVFSMDGDHAPIVALGNVAERFDSWLLIDKAHDLCHSGAGRGDTIIIGTLSKALGSYGGYVCGSRTLVDTLHSAARSLIYTTALPPSALAAALAALDVIEAQPELAERALANARLFTQMMDLGQAQSAIVPVIVGEERAALALSAALEAEGLLATAIRPPTVPQGTARLRLAFSALHQTEEIERLAATIRRNRP